MKRRDFIKSSLTAVAATAAFQTVAGKAMAGSVLKVGVMIPLSGPAGLFGPASKNVFSFSRVRKSPLVTTSIRESGHCSLEILITSSR